MSSKVERIYSGVRYLVRKENFGSTKEVVKEFKREYQWDMENIRRQEQKEETFRKGELLERFMTKKLFGWSDRRYDNDHWGRLERNWR